MREVDIVVEPRPRRASGPRASRAIASGACLVRRPAAASTSTPSTSATPPWCLTTNCSAPCAGPSTTRPLRARLAAAGSVEPWSVVAQRVGGRVMGGCRDRRPPQHGGARGRLDRAARPDRPRAAGDAGPGRVASRSAARDVEQLVAIVEARDAFGRGSTGSRSTDDGRDVSPRTSGKRVDAAFTVHMAGWRRLARGVGAGAAGLADSSGRTLLDRPACDRLRSRNKGAALPVNPTGGERPRVPPTAIRRAA